MDVLSSSGSQKQGCFGSYSASQQLRSLCLRRGVYGSSSRHCSTSALASTVPTARSAGLLQPCIPVSMPFQSNRRTKKARPYGHQSHPELANRSSTFKQMRALPEGLTSALTELAASPNRDYFCLALTVIGSLFWVKIFDVLATGGIVDQVSRCST